MSFTFCQHRNLSLVHQHSWIFENSPFHVWGKHSGGFSDCCPTEAGLPAILQRRRCLSVTSSDSSKHHTLLKSLVFSHVPVSLQRTSRCVSSRTPGRGRAPSPRRTCTGRWRSSSARRPTVTPTLLSQLRWRCSFGGRLTVKWASLWTSSTYQLTQVRCTHLYLPRTCHVSILMWNLSLFLKMNTGWMRRESGQQMYSRTWSWGRCCPVVRSLDTVCCSLKVFMTQKNGICCFSFHPIRPAANELCKENSAT